MLLQENNQLLVDKHHIVDQFPFNTPYSVLLLTYQPAFLHGGKSVLHITAGQSDILLVSSTFVPQLYEILARTQFGLLKRGEVGIARLVSENVFTAAYPLHEVSLFYTQTWLYIMLHVYL